MPVLPSGTIVLWARPVHQIPSGFVICDGTHGTPDLRDRFIVGAGSTYDPDDTGGTSSHNHTFTTDGHYHDLAADAAIQAGTSYDAQTNVKTDSGITSQANHLPPYYALIFIMKT